MIQITKRGVGEKNDLNCSKTIMRRAATLIYTLPGRFTFIYWILASSLSDNIPSSVSVCAFTTRTSCINISNRKRTYIRALSPISNQYVAFPPPTRTTETHWLLDRTKGFSQRALRYSAWATAVSLTKRQDNGQRLAGRRPPATKHFKLFTSVLSFSGDWWRNIVKYWTKLPKQW